MAKITFKPEGQECEAEVGEHLLKVANRNKAGIKFSCGGVPSCAMCRVVVVEGEEHLSKIDRKEIDLMGNTYFLTKQRLSCQAVVENEGDIVVDVSEHLVIKDDPKPGAHYKSKYRLPKEKWPELESDKREDEKSKSRSDRRKSPHQGKKNNNYKGKSDRRRKPKPKTPPQDQV
jgi:ferredoxin